MEQLDSVHMNRKVYSRNLLLSILPSISKPDTDDSLVHASGFRLALFRNRSRTWPMDHTINNKKQALYRGRSDQISILELRPFYPGTATSLQPLMHWAQMALQGVLFKDQNFS